MIAFVIGPSSAASKFSIGSGSVKIRQVFLEVGEFDHRAKFLFATFFLPTRFAMGRKNWMMLLLRIFLQAERCRLKL